MGSASATRLEVNRRPRARTRTCALLLLGALAFLPGCEWETVADWWRGGGLEPYMTGALPIPGAPSPGAEDPFDVFQSTVFPIVSANCTSCHAGAGPGTPALAHPDPQTAYDVILLNQKVSLSVPESSRLVRRLNADFHYCWSDCTANGATMANAVESWAAAEIAASDSSATTVAAISSQTLTLADGLEEDDTGRFDSGAIALYDFREESGTIAYDQSGVAPALDLELSGDATFMTSYGIDFRGGRAEAPAETSRKLYDHIAHPSLGSQQYSIEAWVTPANVSQEGPARMVSYSRGSGSRNFTLGQVLYNYDARNRTVSPASDNNGRPALQTFDGDQDLQATLQHVAVTFDQYRGRRIYVNGVWTDDVDEIPPSRLWNWDVNHRFVLGNESGADRPFEGQIRLVAIFPFVLSDDQIAQNFNAGVGKRLILRFDVSQWAGAGSFVEFVVSELDDYSYLFCEPTMITPQPSGFRVANLRVAVNGVVPVSGQAFVNTDRVVSQGRQRLSGQCSIVPKQLGPADDVFSVEFEYLGSFRDPVPVLPPLPPPPPVFGDPLPLEGFRSFERIRETMAAVTGVDPNVPDARDTYDEIRQALPATFDLRAFSSAQQVSISKLALEFCDAMVESPNLRDAFFGSGVDLDAPASTVFVDPAQRQAMIDALAARLLGAGIGNQPNAAELAPVMHDLFDDLTAPCGASCDVERTRTIAKASCSAVLASAAVSIH